MVKNTEQFIELASKIHNDEFDYSKVNYKSAKEKVVIICKKHGEFLQSPNNHLNGTKCPQCWKERRGLSQRSNTLDFIEKAKLIHGDKYDYSKVDYIKNNLEVEIICNIHGSFFQTPNTHLDNHGCPYCAAEHRGEMRRYSTQQFIEKATLVHGNLYDYSKLEYTTSQEYVDIICKKHGLFKQIANDHLRGAGCPSCHSSKGEKYIEDFLNKRSILYIPQYRIIGDGINRKDCYIDFYIPRFNLFIEYNGIQHYVKQEYFGGIDAFESLQKRDQYVKKYCYEHKINLNIITYKDDIQKKLIEIINTYGSTS